MAQVVQLLWRCCAWGRWNICGPGPHQAAHQGEAPVGRAQESGNDNVSEKENVHVDLYIRGPVPHQAAPLGEAPVGLDLEDARVDL